MTATKSRIPPEAPPALAGFTPASVLKETKTILANSTKLRDQLAASFTEETASFHNIVRPLVDDANRSACRLRILSSLLASVWSDEAVRNASRECEKLITAVESANLMRSDVAALVASVYSRTRGASSVESALDAQDLHLLARMHGEYTRSGASIKDPIQRDRLQSASAELIELRIAAQRTFTEAQDGIWMLSQDLSGVPDGLQSDMKTRQGTYGEEVFVKFSNQHRMSIMRNAQKEVTRRRMYVAQQYRFPENVTRLEKILELRDEIARLLGFENHAALKMEEKMARTVAEVEGQLRELSERLKPLAKADTETLLHLKMKDAENPQNGVEDPLTFYVWDRSYYLNKLKKESFSVDAMEFAEYFETRHTLSGMLAAFENLFGMKFELADVEVWHEDVRTYAVWESPADNGEFLGHLYVDVFERQGKYQGAHHILMRPGFVEGNGTKHHPASALVCSFPNPTSSRPSLLQQSEVKTMFHELGHAIHNILAQTKYAIPHSRDFIEIPSIVLENWIWIPEILVGLSSTASPTLNGTPSGQAAEQADRTLPLSLAQTMCCTKTSDRAHTILSQVQAALFDLAIHTPADRKTALEMNTTTLWNKFKHEIVQHSFGKSSSDWGFGQGGFAHIFRKYDAGYFAYPLSMVYAADLYATGFATNPMDPKAGKRYRRLILEPGSSKSEAEILRDFLGREPSSRAIFEWLNCD